MGVCRWAAEGLEYLGRVGDGVSGYFAYLLVASYLR